MVQVCAIIHEDDVEMGERDEEIGIINWGPQQDRDRDSSPSSNDSNWSIRFRPIEPQDRLRIQELHEEWFPVVYQDELRATRVASNASYRRTSLHVKRKGILQDSHHFRS